MNQTHRHRNATLTSESFPSTRPQNTPSTSPDTDDSWTGNDHLFILASASPRRRELLALLELPFFVVLPEGPPLRPLTFAEQTGPPDIPMNQGGIDETPLPGESPPDLVQRLSRAKVQAVAARLPSLNLPALMPPKRSAIIIAADTEVVSGEEILGKPANPAEAAEMLKRLRQEQWHYVYSGLTVALWSEQDPAQSTAGQADRSPYASLPGMITRLHQSKVWMRAYTDAEIDAYVASGDPLDKAGAYGIQHKIFAPVERLEGCFASVMGLPLGELAAVMTELGLSPPEIAPRCSRYSAYPCCQRTDDAGQ
jgi:septum formation protein